MWCSHGKDHVPAVPNGRKKRTRGRRGGRRKQRNAAAAAAAAAAPQCSAASDVSAISDAGRVSPIQPSRPYSPVITDAGNDAAAAGTDRHGQHHNSAPVQIAGQAAYETPAPISHTAATTATAAASGGRDPKLGDLSVAGHDRLLSPSTVETQNQESPVDWSGMSDAEMLDAYNQLQARQASTVPFPAAAASLVHCQVVAPHAPALHAAAAFQCWMEDGKIVVCIPSGASATLSLFSGTCCSIQCLPDGGTQCTIQQSLPYGSTFSTTLHLPAIHKHN